MFANNQKQNQIEQIMTNLKIDKSEITWLNYEQIIGALKELGYTGDPEQWHENKKGKGGTTRED
jgi:hypothetical protein